MSHERNQQLVPFLPILIPTLADPKLASTETRPLQLPPTAVPHTIVGTYGILYRAWFEAGGIDRLRSFALPATQLSIFRVRISQALPK